MRIISGSCRGKIIEAPKHLPVRPTTDFAKTALFNILNSHFDLSQCEVLDLYAGTGNISYEFLSRGAKEVISVDVELSCKKFIQSTNNKLGFKNAEVVKSDCIKFLSHTEKKFNLIFADPPFAQTPIGELVAKVFDRNLLRPSGWFILEHSSKLNLPEIIQFKETRFYGAVAFSIFVQ